MTAVTSGITTPSHRRSYTTAWWGVATLIMTEGMIFLILVASYFYLQAASKEWPLGGIELPKLELAIPFSILLYASSVPIVWAEAGIRRGDVRRLRIGLLVTFLMGAAFVAFSLHDFHSLQYGWRDNAYGSIYYTTVGLHLLHVVVGLAMNVVVQLKAAMGKFDGGRHATVEVFSLYWHFVDAVWLLVFPVFYLSPHLR